MLRFGGSGVLLDIEGTTTSISFVHDTLFPYARERVRAFLEEHWGDPDVVRARELIAADGGHPPSGIELVVAEVHRLMDADAKATGLKDLQGLIWREGYEKRRLVAHVFDDVPGALDGWRQAGLDIRIYSSGSVDAQILLFRHSVRGDLTPRLNGYFDTKTGPKKDAASYRRIAAAFGLAPRDILFLSDSLWELDAAREAGLVSVLSVRPGNSPVPASHGHPVVRSFDEIEIARASNR